MDYVKVTRHTNFLYGILLKQKNDRQREERIATEIANKELNNIKIIFSEMLENKRAN